MPCKPLRLSKREARALLLAADERLQRLMHFRSQGVLFGHELDARIEVWRSVLRKVEDCLDD